MTLSHLLWAADYDRARDSWEARREYVLDTEHTAEELRAKQHLLREEMYLRHPELRPERSAA